MIIFSRTNMLFFASLFFSTMFPMDPAPKHISISWGDMDKKREQLGDWFALLPQEVIYPYFLIESEPSVKNKLRKTKKAFSELLSWQKMQPFMFCKELCASQDDLMAIIIQNVYSHQAHNPMPSHKKEIIQALGKKLETFSYPIIGCIDDRTERFDLDPVCSGQSEFISLISDCILFTNEYEKGIVTSQSTTAIISPFLIACIARNPHTVERYLKTMASDSFVDDKDIERGLHIIIQNNDIRSLDILPKIGIFSYASKLSQLAVFCASDRVIERIHNFYQEEYAYSPALLREQDFIVSWLNLCNTYETHNDLYWITKMRHKELSKKHASNPEKYHRCLNAIFDAQKLLSFEPAVTIIDKTQK